MIRESEKYFNRPDVQAELGAERNDFNTTSNLVFKDFVDDWMKPYHQIIPKLLANNIQVLVYAGDADYVCNWYGLKAWALEMEWLGKEFFNRQPDKLWFVDGKSVGEVRTGRGLTFLRIFEAGHIVPYDQPEVAQAMLKNWMLVAG